MFFGETGVGKSTIASLIAGTPGLFKSGTSGHETTTRGTWISSPVELRNFVRSAQSNFDSSFNTLLHDVDTEQKNVVFLDTEGLGYQTEVGPNYDVVTILPHTLIAENVFLAVSDKVKPAEVLQLVERLVEAAERTQGSFAHRDGKLFGRLIIVLNKSQKVNANEDEIMSALITANPSLVLKIKQNFKFGPDIVVLPELDWNYDVKPDFERIGYYLTYEDIRKAQPDTMNKMLQGLSAIAKKVYSSSITEVPIPCGNFEIMLNRLYSLTTEDIIDVNQVEYSWLLREAQIKLTEEILQFDTQVTGLTETVLNEVCAETNDKLFKCIKTAVQDVEKEYLNKYLERSKELFPRGQDELSEYIEANLFIRYVKQPVAKLVDKCQSKRHDLLASAMYSNTFLTRFEESTFMEKCSNALDGQISWSEWEECSKSCKTNDKCGVRIRVARSCVPSYAFCKVIPIQRKDCNCIECTPDLSGLPVGTILSWVPRPNMFTTEKTSYKRHRGWIKCDGKEVCPSGVFEGQPCNDLSGRALIGSYENKESGKFYEATLPDHTHPHSHAATSSTPSFQFYSGGEIIGKYERPADYEKCSKVFRVGFY